MKKIMSFVLIFMLGLLFVCKIQNVSADSLVTKNVVKNSETLDGGIEYKYEESTVKGYNTSNTFTSNVMSLKLNNANNGTVKLATWTYNARYETSNVSLDKIAADYETNHPGWKVVGGINSEGWWSSSGHNQISNTYVCDGEIYRTGVSSESFKELIGIYPNNTTYITRFPSYTDNMKLNLYDADGKIIDTLDVNKLNELPGAGELSVVTIQAGTINVDGYYLVEGDYTTYRRPIFYIEGSYPITDTDDGIYLKGTIKGISNKTSISGLDYKFYFVSKDQSVINKIAEATTIRCQYEFTDEFKNTPNITGYMFKLMENGHVYTPDDRQDNSQYVGITRGDDSYYYRDHAYATTNGKRRAGIGFTADGGIVLMTALTETGQGPNQYQFGQLLKEKGCVDAYQFDGGSSVTFVKRDEFGSFKLISNTQGSIATGIFFVVPDPELSAVSSTRWTMSFNIGNQDVSNVKVHINGQSYSLDQDHLTVNGLTEGTEYEYYFTYDIPSYLDPTKTVSTRTMVYHKYTENYVYPNPKFSISEINKNSITVVKGNTTDNISNVIVNISGQDYQMGANTSLKIDELIDDTEYQISYSYDVLDPESGLTYHGTVDASSFKTKSFNVPSITEFKVYRDLTDGKVTFKYKYLDDDEVAFDIYLYCNDQVEELTKVSGSVSFENLGNQYSAYIELSYNDGDKKITISSDKIEYKAPDQKDDPDEKKDENTEPVSEKKKCGKKSAQFVISLISITTIISLILRKKH